MVLVVVVIVQLLVVFSLLRESLIVLFFHWCPLMSDNWSGCFFGARRRVGSMAPVCDVSRLLLLLLLWLLLQGIETFVLQDYGLVSLGLGPIQFKLGQVSYFGIGRPFFGRLLWRWVCRGEHDWWGDRRLHRIVAGEP